MLETVLNLIKWLENIKLKDIEANNPAARYQFVEMGLVSLALILLYKHSTQSKTAWKLFFKLKTLTVTLPLYPTSIIPLSTCIFPCPLIQAGPLPEKSFQFCSIEKSFPQSGTLISESAYEILFKVRAPSTNFAHSFLGIIFLSLLAFSLNSRISGISSDSHGVTTRDSRTRKNCEFSLSRKGPEKMGEKKSKRVKANKLVYMLGIQFILCILAGL